MKTYINKFYAVIGFVFLCLALPAQAHHGGFHPHRHHHHHHQRHHWHPHYGWVIPAVIGGVVTYEIVRNRPIVVEREVVENDPRCGEWREIQTSDGRIYRERICRQD